MLDATDDSRRPTGLDWVGQRFGCGRGVAAVVSDSGVWPLPIHVLFQGLPGIYQAYRAPH